MPEIRSEVPSDAELREYFELSAREHGLHLLSLDDAPLVEAMGAKHGAAVAMMRSIAGGEFDRRAHESVFVSLQRLNRLSRSHPFWRNTNLRPTFYKLTEFCEMRIAADPADEIALWCQGVQDANGGWRLGMNYWLRLHRLGKFPLSWAPCPSFWASFVRNDYHHQFVDFFAAAAPDGDIAEFLKPYSECGNALVAGWADEVLAAWRESHP